MIGSADRSAARVEVAQAARRLAAHGMTIGTAGNVGLRLPDGTVAITATGVVLGEATPGDVTVVDATGTVVEGDLAPTSELDLHLSLMSRADAVAVVHTHSPVATALSLVLDEVPVVHYQQLELGGSVPVVPFAVFGSQALAEAVSAALSTRTAALLANHGTVAIGPDLGTAVERSLLLEWACTLYWRAAAIGTPRVLDAEAQHSVARTVADTGYGRPRFAGAGRRPDGLPAPSPSDPVDGPASP